MPDQPLSVSEFIEHCNGVIGPVFENIIIEGEVASFKVNQGKWIFFDLREEDSSISCFMAKWQLSIALEDGMKVRVQATPKLTRWGKFSLTIERVLPVGEGNIKKSFELLKKKLTAEGLFAPEKKRPLPEVITKIGVISSTGAAGYIDFLKILDNRWGGLEIYTVNTQVQGIAAPAQIVRALEYFNQRGGVDVLAIIRGGGSADDLSAFNDEALARAIAGSKIPVITGIGHEVDESLADLAADVRASTPSNAAERLSPDRTAVKQQISTRFSGLKYVILDRVESLNQDIISRTADLRPLLLQKISELSRLVAEKTKILESLSPEGVLKRGYAIITGKLSPGENVKITTSEQFLTAEIQNVEKRTH